MPLWLSAYLVGSDFTICSGCSSFENVCRTNHSKVGLIYNASHVGLRLSDANNADLLTYSYAQCTAMYIFQYQIY